MHHMTVRGLRLSSSVILLQHRQLQWNGVLNTVKFIAYCSFSYADRDDVLLKTVGCVGEIVGGSADKQSTGQDTADTSSQSVGQRM